MFSCLDLKDFLKCTSVDYQ